MTQAIRNFAKSLESWLTHAMVNIPEEMLRVKVSGLAVRLQHWLKGSSACLLCVCEDVPLKGLRAGSRLLLLRIPRDPYLKGSQGLSTSDISLPYLPVCHLSTYLLRHSFTV